MSKQEIERSSCRYTSKYCEENVWQLAADPRLAGARRSALFISNAKRAVPLWAQRAASAPDEPVVWDYHVVLLVHVERPRIYDLDSTLPFPCDALEYLRATFPLAGALPPGFEPRFRRVDARELAESFASDRSHMLGPDGAYLAEPPPWPPIRTSKETMNLDAFVDMTGPGPGELFDLAALRERLGARETR